MSKIYQSQDNIIEKINEFEKECFNKLDLLQCNQLALQNPLKFEVNFLCLTNKWAIHFLFLLFSSFQYSGQKTKFNIGKFCR